MLQDLQDLQNQMGNLHIHWQRNTILHQCIQTYRPKISFPYQHFRKPAQTQTNKQTNEQKNPHPPTNSRRQESTNLTAQIAIRPTLDRPNAAFPNVMMNTKRHSTATAIHQTSPNTSLKKLIPLALSVT